MYVSGTFRKNCRHIRFVKKIRFVNCGTYTQIVVSLRLRSVLRLDCVSAECIWVWAVGVQDKLLTARQKSDCCIMRDWGSLFQSFGLHNGLWGFGLAQLRGCRGLVCLILMWSSQDIVGNKTYSITVWRNRRPATHATYLSYVKLPGANYWW